MQSIQPPASYLWLQILIFPSFKEHATKLLMYEHISLSPFLLPMKYDMAIHIENFGCLSTKYMYVNPHI